MATLLRRTIARPVPITSRILARPSQRRFLDTSTAPEIYAAHVQIKGARKGHVKGDGLEVDLAMPKAMGGPGGAAKTNPEELFAAGYGACFQSAMLAVAPGLKVRIPEDSTIDTTVNLVGDLKTLDLGLRVNIKVHTPKGLTKEDLQKVVDEAKTKCPYSRATKGNVHTTIEVV